MIRRAPGLFVSAAIAAVLLTGCSNAGPVLTDPKEIVTAALKSSEAAKTVHVDVTVDGTAAVIVPGGGATAAPLTLTGTTAAADVDVANGALHATLAVPTLFGFSADLIVVDARSYLKTTGSDDRYAVSDLDGSPLDPTDMGGLIDNLGDVLLGSSMTLVKGDDVACGSRTCYTVQTTLTAAQIASLGGAALAGLPVDLEGATVGLTLRVEKDLPDHLAGLSAELRTPAGQSLKVVLTFSKWDAAVSVSAPPQDQLKPGS